MKKTLLLLALLGCCSGLLAQSYAIKGPAEPKPWEKTAIQELENYLARRIGEHTLSIGGQSPVTFQVGDTELARQQHCLSSELEDEQWVIRLIGNDLMISGGGTRGTLYATYHFLEDYCDIHWWSDYEEHVPEASDLSLDALDTTGKPAFIYRDIYRSFPSLDAARTAIRVRLNRNGGEHLTVIPTELGGSFTYGNPEHCHTFDSYVPFAKMGAEHPEYFSLVDGKRIGGKYVGQLCLSNPELKQLFLSQMLEFIRKDLETTQAKGLLPARIYDISMNDNWNRCTCPDCQAEDEKYNPSGHYLNFVNWVAGEVSKQYPNLYFSTLAYFYTEPPPKGGVRAADNVIVKLCDTRTNQAASILEEQNKIFLDFLQAWKSHAKNLFVWDYAIIYTDGLTGFPFASEFTYANVHRTYHENNVTGVFWEHENPHLSDFFELKYFMESKLLEDPYQDANKLIDLFMSRYYGAAGEQVLAYRRAVDNARRRNNGYVSWFPKLKDFAYLTPEVIVECQGILDRAEQAVADDPVRKARVIHARSGLDRLTCRRAEELAALDKQELVIAAWRRLTKDRPAWVKGWKAEDEILNIFQNEANALAPIVRKALGL